MLILEKSERDALWQQLAETIENYTGQVADLPVAPLIDVSEIHSRLANFNFFEPVTPFDALSFAAKNLREFQVHTPHPRYFGLFNPAPTTMGIIADALVAAFNPQLAAWSHSPFAAEVEQHLIRIFAALFGYDALAADGTFCSGGAEANHTALIAALVSHFPDFENEGLQGLEKQPVFYLSSQSHHSFVKAARFCGLGTNAVREIKSDAHFRIDPADLVAQIERDRAGNYAPFFIIATAGTTNAGIVDDITKLAEIAKRENLWFHVDAAWGGAAAFVPELKTILNGIEHADSITFDAHKLLSVPMSAGIFLTRHSEILHQACRVTADYMPHDAGTFNVTDTFVHSLQWSRRFIGLKIFLSLAVAGWKGYEETIRHQTAMGDFLRGELVKSDWEILNQTPLPVVCFRDRKFTGKDENSYLNALAAEVISSGAAWLSTTRLEANLSVLRACITNYATQEEDVQRLVKELCHARRKLSL